MAINAQELQKVIELVYVLAGQRGDKKKSALLRGELSNLQEFIATLTKGAKTLESQLNVINGDVVQAKQDITAQQAQLGELSQGLMIVQQGLASAQLTLNQLNQDLTTAQAHIDSIAEGSSTATQDLATLKQSAGAVGIPDPATANLAAVIEALSALKNAVAT